MPWTAAAIVGGAVIGAVGSNMAANKQAAGQEAAANTQAGMFNTLQGIQNPFIQQGTTAATQLQDILNPANAGELQNYISNLPGYQFQLQTGGEALTNSLTPGSGALSGSTLKSLMGFNQGLAGTYYNNYVNQLMGQMNTGEAGAAALGGVGQGLGTGVAQAQAAAAGSQAAGTVGEANAITSSVPLSLLYANQGTGGGGGGLSGNAYDQYGAPAALGPNGYINTPSDRRLKEDIKRVGKTDGGLPVYTFRYKGGQQMHMGVMADEVIGKIPNAVSKGDDGFYRVNYGMLE